MTGNILSLSRLENQTIITDQEAFHVDEQIRQCILLRETIWSEKNLVIDPNLDSIIWKGNRELTSHIWSNLLDNAIKFTPAGGEITIRASMDKDWLTVSFTDTGIGMTPEVKQRVFDKFYQGDTSHKKKGNGLGLALVRQIVTLYGGSVEVESAPDMEAPSLSAFRHILFLRSLLRAECFTLFTLNILAVNGDRSRHRACSFFLYGLFSTDQF